MSDIEGIRIALILRTEKKYETPLAMGAAKNQAPAPAKGPGYA
jgi:hypothetical protein